MGANTPVFHVIGKGKKGVAKKRKVYSEDKKKL